MDGSAEENPQTVGSSVASTEVMDTQRSGSDDTTLPDHDSADVIASGIAAVLGPVVRDFDARVEGALKSQSLLTSSIDRLTKELDRLLEDTPLPLVAQHAAKLSGVRKRVGSLTHTLRAIQGRINNMDRMLSERDAITPSSNPRSAPAPGTLPVGFSQTKETSS